jgi:hypothetical protein
MALLALSVQVQDGTGPRLSIASGLHKARKPAQSMNTSRAAIQDAVDFSVWGPALGTGLRAAGNAWSRDFRVNMISNGQVFGCANCHVSSFGGGARNPFGMAVGAITGSSAVAFWSAALAAQDADGDGFRRTMAAKDLHRGGARRRLTANETDKVEADYFSAACGGRPRPEPGPASRRPRLTRCPSAAGRRIAGADPGPQGRRPA